MKKSIRILAIFLAAIAMASTAQAKSKTAAPTDTVVCTVTPQMHCQNCENKIKSNLRFEKGVKSIVTDRKSQTVTVIYNANDTDFETIAKALKKIGYTAVRKNSNEE